MPKDGQNFQQDRIGRRFSDSTNTMNKLTLAFAKAAAKNQDDVSDNLIVSPYNAVMALSMLAKAADGDSKEQLAQALFQTDADGMDDAIAQLAQLNTDILEANKDQVELKTANGLWSNDELLTLCQNFAQELRQVFDAEINGEKFSDPSVPAKINQWASDNTNALITEIVETLSKDDFAILASALYFKGEWTNKFDTDLTEDRGFTTDDGAVSDTPTMQKILKEEGDVKYLDADDYEAIAMTYGENDYQERKQPTMRMVLIRPKDDAVEARNLIDKQADGDMPAWMEPSMFQNVVGKIELPRMDIKQKHDLIPVLKDMGITDVFDEEKADLTNMIEEKGEQLYVNKVTHDVVFKTDEEGSEAAAVTTIGVIRATSMPSMPKSIDLKFDRSYVFALQDIKTGTILFAGAVNKPNEDMTPRRKNTGPKMG